MDVMEANVAAGPIEDDQEPRFRLIYFDARGAAELIRTLFALGGEGFEDVRYPVYFAKDEKTGRTKIERPEFEAAQRAGKFRMGMGRLPILEVRDGIMGCDPNSSAGHTCDTEPVIISQSHAIERFLAMRFGLMGQSDVETAQIDAICEHIRDLKDMYSKVKGISCWVFGCKDHSEDQCPSKAWQEFELPKWMSTLEAACSDMIRQTGYAVGDKLSLADVAIWNFCTQFFDDKVAMQAALATSPGLQKVVRNVANHPNVNIWLQQRPKTMM